MAGAFGTIAVGFLDPTDGLFYNGGNPGLLITQIYGVLALGCLGAIPLGVMALFMRRFDFLRCSPEEEEVGLDLFVFGLSAYQHVEDQSHLLKKGPFGGYRLKDTSALPNSYLEEGSKYMV